MTTQIGYVDKNSTYVQCGRCSKSVRPHRRHIKIYRGGSHGNAKSFHMLCALREIKEAQDMVMDAIKKNVKGGRSAQRLLAL